MDATNVIRKPVVCVISSLGMDHTDILGDTLEKIATEKAGIMKPGARVFTSPQKPEAMAALERRAKEVGCELVVIKSLDDYKDGEEIEVSLAGPHQRENASLAVALVREWANVTKQPWATEMEASFQRNELPAFMRRGLAKTVWPGRSQVIDDLEEKNLTFFLDGAHTVGTHRVLQTTADGAARTGELYNYVANFGNFIVIVTANPLVLPDATVVSVDTQRARELVTRAVNAVKGGG